MRETSYSKKTLPNILLFLTFIYFIFPTSAEEIPSLQKIKEMVKKGNITKALNAVTSFIKEHPDKSYRDLERYRDADRIEEAQRIRVIESRQKQEDLELKKEVGACITAGMKRDRIAMKTMKNNKEVKNEYDYHQSKIGYFYSWIF